MIISNKEDKKRSFPDLFLFDAILPVRDEVKYFGHYMTADFSDDRDLYMHCRLQYVQANVFIRKFFMCSVAVKITLFWRSTHELEKD